MLEREKKNSSEAFIAANDNWHAYKWDEIVKTS